MTEPAKLSLMAVIDAYAAALDSVDPETGEVAPELDALFAEIAPQLPERLEALAGARRRLIADAKANDDLAKLYHARSVALGKSVERLEAYAKACLELAEQRKIKTPTAAVWLAETKSVQVDCPPEQLPKAYQREVPARIEADKKALKEALDAGTLISHVSLVTKMGVRFA
jgi:hypothetical protein